MGLRGAVARRAARRYVRPAAAGRWGVPACPRRAGLCVLCRRDESSRLPAGFPARATSALASLGPTPPRRARVAPTPRASSPWTSSSPSPPTSSSAPPASTTASGKTCRRAGASSPTRKHHRRARRRRARPAGELWVRTLGGVVDKIGQAVPGEAQLAAGSRALLFLAQGPGRGGRHGDGQGHYPIVADDKGVARLTPEPRRGDARRRAAGPTISAHERLVGAHRRRRSGPGRRSPEGRTMRSK